MTRVSQSRRIMPQGAIDPVDAFGAEPGDVATASVTWRGYVPLPMMRVSIGGVVRNFASLVGTTGGTQSVSVLIDGLGEGSYAVQFDLVSDIRQARSLASVTSTLVITSDPSSPVAVEASSTFGYNTTSPNTVALPTVADGDIVAVFIAAAGAEDPGAPSATVNGAALTTLYSNFAGGAFRTRLSCLWRAIDSSFSGTTLSVSPGTQADSVGWMILSGASFLEVESATNGDTDDGISFGAGTSSAAEMLIRHEGHQGATHVVVSSGAMSGWSLTVDQSASNRGQSVWTRATPDGETVGSASFTDAGDNPYDNWSAVTIRAGKGVASGGGSGWSTPADFLETLPLALRVVDVANRTQLLAAIAAAVPGDRIVMATADYGSVDIEGVEGTAANPIVFTPALGATATWSGTGGGACPLNAYEDVSYVKIGVFDGRTGSLVMDAVNTSANAARIGKDTATYGTVDHVTLTGVELTGSQFGLVDVKSAASFVLFTGCVFHDSGQTTPQNGEMVYIGSTSGTNAVHDVTIRGCEMYNGTAEAIDCKGSGTYNILIEDNQIHDIDIVGVASQFNLAAITIGGYSGSSGVSEGSPSVANPNVVIRRNRIWNITESGLDTYGHGRGIVLGSAATCIDNVIWNVARDGISVWDYWHPKPSGFGGWVIDHNTIWLTDQGGGGTNYDIELAHTETSTGTHLTVRNNLADVSHVTVGTVSGNATPISGDFVGPLTTDADAGDGAGSGFVLDSGASHIDAVTVSPAVPVDLIGTARPQGANADRGAIETA